MSTSAGVLVVSCISTRFGWKAISSSLVPVSSQRSTPFTARWRSSPCVFRMTFSSNSRSTTGNRVSALSNMAGRST